MIITSHDLVQFFSCERKAYHLLHEGCSTSIMASFLRENVRVIDEFCNNYFNKPERIVINSPSIDEACDATKNVLLNEQSTIVHAIISSGNTLYSYVPICTWHKGLKGWVLHFCTVSSGLRAEHKIHAACALYECKKLNIPVAQVVLHFLVSPDENTEEYKNIYKNNISWTESDITNKTEKALESMTVKLDNFLEFTQSQKYNEIENWQKCDRQYCDVCAVEKTSDVNDVKTLRKSKVLIDDLLAQGISEITNIPNSIELHKVVSRQVEAVQENKNLFFEDEVRQFLQQLVYPRYYLDFEAFATAIPTVKNIRPKGFVPFLFSLQWQNFEDDVIHTQLWAMPYASDKRVEMWQALSSALKNAGCIVVYNSDFEKEMIKQLSYIGKEKQKAYGLTSKLVDLQKVFMDLSVYKPEQKGKISLKTVTSLWLGGNYKAFKVSEGMLANYFYTVLSDEKSNAFKTISQSPYIRILLEKINYFDKQHIITMQDIADYCKYDTQVMIQLVALLEKMYEEN